MENKRDDIILLKNNFCQIYQDLLDFLRLISKNNFGMFYLLSNYFMENHFKNNIIEDDYKTNHRCVKFDKNEIEILDNKENHICECSFFTLFLLNWRDKISNEKNNKFLLSFSRSFPLKNAFGIIYFCFNKQILLNENLNIINNRIQFILDYSTKMLVEKTNIIEETYELFYKYFSETINSENSKNGDDNYYDDILNELLNMSKIMEVDCQLFSMPMTRKLIYNKISLIKRTIDCLCLLHNKIEFKSIYPHPVFQEKKFSLKFINLELYLLFIVKCINLFTQWDKVNNIKDIFKYIINKIINQESEGIKILEKDEYSFHLSLYRAFGLLINYFCFYYSLKNKCTLFDSIQFFKKNFFESEIQLINLTDIILTDYFKFFGFISGIKNRFFEYYNSLAKYPGVYFYDQKILKIDFTLLKYLFVISRQNINLDNFFKLSHIENSFNFFENSFLLKNNIISNDKKKKENTKKENINSNVLSRNLTSDELLDVINNTNNIFPNSINYGENLEVIRILQKEYNTEINENIIQQNINSNRIIINEKIDEFNNTMHIKLLLETLIILIKDDSSPFYNLMHYYSSTSSTETRNELFDDIKKDKEAMNDLKNILKEKIIHEFVSNGNLCNINEIKENIDNYLFYIFDEKEFNNMIDELTLNKKIGNSKLFYLKDINLKYLDISYYYSFRDKSNAQRYIFDFKKDKVKSFNTYFYPPSKLTFDFLRKTVVKYS